MLSPAYTCNDGNAAVLWLVFSPEITGSPGLQNLDFQLTVVLVKKVLKVIKAIVGLINRPYIIMKFSIAECPCQ